MYEKHFYDYNKIFVVIINNYNNKYLDQLTDKLI